MSHQNYPPGADEDAMGVSNNDTFEDLHSIAGLVDAGTNEDGDIEWIGSDKCWSKYHELVQRNEEEEFFGKLY